MGTSGLSWGRQAHSLQWLFYDFWTLLFIVIGLHFITHALLTLHFSELMCTRGWIKPDDMLLPSQL